MQTGMLVPPRALAPRIAQLFELSGQKIRSIVGGCDPGKHAPVFTIERRYASRGWTI